MATSLDYANWLRNNQNKRGTPDYATVLRAYQEAALEENQAAQAPALATPTAPAQRTGFGAAVGKGLESLIGTTTTGVQAATGDANQAAELALKRAAASPYADQVSWDKVKEIYATQGALAAAFEVARQAPLAIAEQLPQLGVSLGATMAGAKVGALTSPVTGPVGPIVGGGLGFLASTMPSIFGSNIERQAAEQQQAGKPIDIDVGAAAGTAALQTGLEAAGTFIPLGRTVAGKLFGPQVEALLKQGRKDAAEALARESLGKMAAKGAAVGVAAEVPTEVVQQALERAQAGLPVLSDDALTEYAQAAYQTALVGAPLGTAGRAVSRSEARTAQAEAAEAETAKQRKAAREAAEAEKKTPEYLLNLEARYKAAVAKKAELDEAAKKPAPGADPATMVAYRNAVRARDDFAKTEMSAVAEEYEGRKKEIDQLKERRRVEGMTPFDYLMEQAQEVPAMHPKKLPFTTEDTEIFPTIARVPPLVDYATKRIALANEQRYAKELDPKDRAGIYAEYLLASIPTARRLVQANEQLPDLGKRESDTVLSLVKEGLKKYDMQQAADIAAERPDLAPQKTDVDTFAPWKQAIEAEERLREEEAVAVEPVRKEEAVISPERESLLQERETARRRYFAAAATYEKARGTPDGVRALQQLLAARRQYEELFPASAVSQLPQPVLLPETEAQLDKALEATVGEAPSSAEELEARVQRMADTRKTAIAKVAENAAELDQYERLTRYMGTKQGLSEIARTPEMAEAAKRRMTPMLEQAQASRNEAIAAAIQEIKLQRDVSGLVPLSKTDAELQAEFRDKLNRDLQQAKGKSGYTEKRRQEALAEQLRRINARIQQLESGDRVGRLLGYASAFRGQQERTGELSNLYKAYKNLSMQQGLTPQAVQLNRTLQNLIDFYTVGGGAAKPRLVAKGPREAKRELVLGERAFTGYEPTIEGTEVRYDKPRKKEAFKATPEEQALVEDMRARELAKLNEAADRQYTPETSDRVKEQILDELRARIDGFNAPATQEEVAAAQAQAAPQDQDTGDLFAAATERAQAEFQAAGERRTAARSEFGRAMAGMRGKSAIMDQAQRLAEAFGKDLGLRGTYAEAKEKLTKARAEKRAAETEFTEKEQEALRAAADDALIAQREAEAANRAANNTVDAVAARLEAERQTPTVEVRTPPRAVVLLRKIAALQALISEQKTKVVSGDKTGTTFAPVTEVGFVKSALDQAVRAAKEGEAWASDIEQVQAHMATLEKYLSRREAQGRLLPAAELMAKEWYRKLAAHETALRRPMYGAGQLTPAEIRDYTQRRLEMAQAEYDRIKLQIDGLHRQLLDTEVSVAKREVDRINSDINKLVARTERREGADLANQELQALMAQHKDAVANLNAAQKIFDERKKAESVPFTRKSPASALEQWMKGAQDRFEQSVQRFKDKQAALERQAIAPAGTVATTATERRVEAAREAAAKAGEPRLEAQLEAALLAQRKLKKRGSKKQREAIAEKIADLRKRLGGASSYGEEYYETSAQQQAAEEAREAAKISEAREAGKEETTRAGRRKAAKEIFGVQRTIAETGEVPQAVRDGNKLDTIIKSNRQAFEMAVEQGFKSTTIRPQKRGKSATPERLMRTPIEGIAYRLRQEIVEKMSAPQTKEEKKALTELRERLYGLEEAINTAPVTVEERRRTARAIWAKLPKDMRSSVVDTFSGRTESGGISVSFFDRFADALETTVIRERLGQPLSQAPVTTMTKAELAPIQAETEKRVAATLKATEELRQKYYEQKEKELADKAQLQGQIDEATQRQIEKEAKEFADSVVQRIKEEEAREATRRMTEPMRRKPTANVPGEIGPQFSRGPTATPSTTDSVRTELKTAFPDLGRVQIYDSVDALIAANPQYKGKIPADARGFVDSAGNKAFLIAENINQGQALSVLLHEVGAHVGLKSLLGDAQYSALVNAVKSWEKKTDGSIEAKVAQAARARVEAAETPAGQVNDELLAYAIEEAVNAGVKPMETKGVLGRWLSQIATLFRRALEKFGLPPKALDAQGLVDMAFGAAKMEMRGAEAPQMSRRTFLRGAGAALGAMKLPPLSKDMQVGALKAAFEGSLKASDVWFAAAKAAVGKNKSLLTFLDDAQYDDMALESFVKSRDLSSFLYHVAYDENYDGKGYDYYLNDLLSGKDGVKIVADLQQALQAQRAAVVEAVQKMAKEKGLPEVGELYFSVPKGKPSRIDTYEAAKKHDARLLKQVEQFLLTGTPVPAPTTLYRGGTEIGRTYTHATPWAAVAAKAGKLIGYDPRKPEPIYEYAAAEDQKYYRGGALEGDPLETTRIHNAKGMTWDQALNAAKKLFDAEVRALPDRYMDAYLADPENKQYAVEAIAGQVTEDFFAAVYETDAANKPGVWANRKVPDELMQDTPKLRKATRRMTEPMRSKPEVASEDFMPTPKPPSGPAFKTRILPDGTRKQVLRPAAKPEGLPRIEEGRSDSDFYKVTGFQPDASAPFHKMTLAEAARFGASKARGQRKELFTRLADLFDEATTPEKQGLVLATNGKPSNAAAYGAFYRNSNVVFSPGIKQTGYLETLLHELTHAASWYALSVDKQLAGRVESLRRKAAAWAETKEGKAYIRKHAMFLVAKDQQGNRGIYGLKNIDEFLSELYADREFQKFLTQIPSDAPKKNLLTRFVEFMSSFFSAPDQAQQSLFAEAVALSEEVLETTRREIYGTDIELSEVRRSRLPFGIEGPPDVAFSTKMPTASRVANQIVGKEKGLIDKFRDNFLGIGGRAQYIDKLFPTEAALQRAGADPTKAMQAMYYLRMVDQQMHFTSQAITDGVPERREITRPDGSKEYLIEAKPGANLKQAFDILKRKDVVKETGSADASNKLATLYMAAIRGENKGYETLNFGRVWAQGEIKRIENELKSPKLSAEQRTVLTKRMNRLESRLDSMPTPEDIKAAKAEIDANPVLRDAFNEVRDIYNQYNRDLINFNVQTGALSRDQAKTLLQENDYIPYYRMRDGVAELIIGKETPIRIGNLKDSPHLQELVGGDEPIMDFIASSIQNTSMLINMATHNLAMRNLMFEFKDLGLATVGKVKGGNAPAGAVTFKLDGVEHFGVVDTEALGISSDLLVKGLAGIPTMFPAFVRVMGMPARFLRRMIVASPLYMARQLFRDSLAASIASGSNTVPVLSALKQIGKAGALERRGITGGQVFTGMPEDMSRMVKEMQAGKISVPSGLAYLEGKAAQVDALTRRAQYEDYLKQGLSEMEATYMALESMNFSRRGLSPSMHMASTLIPFFNAQIQGLDVLYRSFTGQMPMNERLGIRKKLIARGMLLFGLSMAYAMAMQDDEAYKNAKPDEKYGNWFVSLPGVEQPIRLPIPFELGYVFKALPEAIVNTLANEEGGEEAFKALKHIVQQMIPGGSSYMIPAAVKPLAEVGSGVSAYTLRDIESAREQQIEPEYRARESTTELAKIVGKMTGFSPIKLEYLISGYTGQMGMALISALSAPFAGTGEGPAPATKRPSDLPLVGTLFQPKDASGIIDLVYERMNKVRQVQETYKRLIADNKPEQAKRYAEEKADELAQASVAGAFREQMGQITEFERQVRASTLAPDRKRAELDRARQAKINLARAVQGLSGRTAPQAARP